ncbi:MULTISPECIES: Lon protease family protein [Gammaproteobacteria]|uniref:AAA family ATPase n=1 Tax=Gammaproteobacteria TaxID=1236 RepID=UPI000DD01BFE|nr:MULTISPECIES: Lon protease family protein [Gammaproteobacteria]RTE87225.1 Lon protease family protein [Aliidiomarina sp. B3213]TCZ92987.1 Lon protease family protein [Lysobacter sp. N42]
MTKMVHADNLVKLPTHLLTADSSHWLKAILDKEHQPSALVGQKRALQALQQALRSRSQYSHAYIALTPGLIAEDILNETSKALPFPDKIRYDWVYVANPETAYQPICIWLPHGSAVVFVEKLYYFLELELDKRTQAKEDLMTEFPSSALSAYLELVFDKTFDDLPGNELASVLVSNENARPFEYCRRVTAASLFGSIKSQSLNGTISSELHLIRAGAIHRANGGTLIIDAAELLSEPQLWSRLKHALRTGEVDWPDTLEQSAALFYEPEPMPLDIKVLLAGPAELFHQLEELDPDFSNFFPFIADFSTAFHTEHENIEAYGNYMAYLQQKTRHRPFTEQGVASFLEWSTALCEHQKELSLDAIRLIQLLEEVDEIADQHESQVIEREHVEKAAQLQRYRGSRVAEMNWRQITENQIQIETHGRVVGQINGLTVVTMTGIEYGEPSRITATVHYGDGDIIDIERKSELSGSIHTKGVMILTAFLANLFARKEPMPLSATLVFEQSYHEVDGDSASLAELCALLSALSDIPVIQSIAVTGAIDQFGNVQAVGGINEKISGYYEICKSRGLDGNHGVIIPASNQWNLHLSAEIRSAVEQGLFHVYTASHVFQALEKLLDTPFGSDNEELENSISSRVKYRLRQANHEHEVENSLWSRLFSRK